MLDQAARCGSSSVKPHKRVRAHYIPQQKINGIIKPHTSDLSTCATAADRVEGGLGISSGLISPLGSKGWCYSCDTAILDVICGQPLQESFLGEPCTAQQGCTRRCQTWFWVLIVGTCTAMAGRMTSWSQQESCSPAEELQVRCDRSRPARLLHVGAGGCRWRLDIHLDASARGTRDTVTAF
jgi:hypothetical protein